MRRSTSFFVGPHKTPSSVKWVMWITIALSLLSPVVTYFLEHYTHLPGPGAWLSLSRSGMRQGWLWEPFTYFFLHTAGVGVSFALLLSLFLHMLVLWFTGSEVAFRYGPKGFLLFYCGAGLFSGIATALVLFLSASTAVLVGSGPPIYALVILWAMLYPELELYFFVLVRIKAKWLAALFLGMSLLINLSYGEFIPFFAHLCGILWGFLIGRFVLKLPNPFPLNLELPRRKRKRSESKIIDIAVFQEDDEAFIDRMLDKIAQSGEESLTKRERERMEKISARKKREP